eukprot:SAG22_NODE_1825_length_3505_cov_3.818849_2_plen_199_part_00
MMRPLQLALLATTAAAAAASGTADKWAYQNVPWPLPQHMTAGRQAVVLAPSMALFCDPAAGCDPATCTADGVLARAVRRYGPILSPAGAPPAGPAEVVLGKIEVCVADAKELLGPAMNESHALAVPSHAGGAIRVDAASQHGALRALESLAHLVSLTRPGRIVNAPVQVEDRPRWPVRGLMVNPAGRFMSTAFLKVSL